MNSLKLVCVALLATSCAVVTAVSEGLDAVGWWGEGIDRGAGAVVDGLQQGEWEYFGESGEKRVSGSFKDDVPSGPWTYYYPGGAKESEGTLAHERRVGLWRYYFPGGSNKAFGYFDDGREFGQWLFWDPSGQRRQRGSFVDGLQSNLWTYWHPDGTKLARGSFFKGKKVGRWEFWDTQGVATQKDYELPDSIELVFETWPNGATRREGFMRMGSKEGLWLTYHRNNQLRMVGSFESGVPDGRWMAFRGNGERMALGSVERGRPTGNWDLWGAGGRRAWNASGASPAVPMIGDWSLASAPDTAGSEATLGVWLAEASTEVERTVVVEESAPEAPPTPEQLAVVEEEPDVPVNVSPWTQREIRDLARWTTAYTKIGADMGDLVSRYVPTTGSKSAGEPTGGNPERAARYLGKPLPLALYRDENGRPFDLESVRGQNVILVVLRGFAGGVCVYCTTQTKALCKAGAFDKFDELDTRLLVLYPGGRNHLKAFKRGFAQLSKAQIPPYGLLYQQDFIVADELNLDGDKVIPSTFILDKNGIVRFAYLGEHVADRPSVELLFDELDKIIAVQ